MADTGKKVEVRYGGFACVIEGYDNPVEQLREVLGLMQTMIAETPALREMPSNFDAESVEEALRESGDADSTAPGVVVIRSPEGGTAAEPAGTEAGFVDAEELEPDDAAPADAMARAATAEDQTDAPEDAAVDEGHAKDGDAVAAWDRPADANAEDGDDRAPDLSLRDREPDAEVAALSPEPDDETGAEARDEASWSAPDVDAGTGRKPGGIAAGLAAAGVGIAGAFGLRANRARDAVEDAAEAATEAVTDAAGTARDAGAEAAGSLRDRAGDMVDGLGAQVSDVARPLDDIADAGRASVSDRLTDLGSALRQSDDAGPADVADEKPSTFNIFAAPEDDDPPEPEESATGSVGADRPDEEPAAFNLFAAPEDQGLWDPVETDPTPLEDDAAAEVEPLASEPFRGTEDAPAEPFEHAADLETPPSDAEPEAIPEPELSTEQDAPTEPTPAAFGSLLSRNIFRTPVPDPDKDEATEPEIAEPDVVEYKAPDLHDTPSEDVDAKSDEPTMAPAAAAFASPDGDNPDAGSDESDGMPADSAVEQAVTTATAAYLAPEPEAAQPADANGTWDAAPEPDTALNIFAAPPEDEAQDTQSAPDAPMSPTGETTGETTVDGGPQPSDPPSADDQVPPQDASPFASPFAPVEGQADLTGPVAEDAAPEPFASQEAPEAAAFDPIPVPLPDPPEPETPPAETGFDAAGTGTSAFSPDPDLGQPSTDADPEPVAAPADDASSFFPPMPEPESDETAAAQSEEAEPAEREPFDAVLQRVHGASLIGAPGADVGSTDPGVPDPYAATLTAPMMAEQAQATAVVDLLECSAAWLTLSQGRPRFTRREVMEVFDSLPGDHPRTLEARIKGFGRLVRSGSLILIDDGVFAMAQSARERFREALSAGAV